MNSTSLPIVGGCILINDIIKKLDNVTSLENKIKGEKTKRFENLGIPIGFFSNYNKKQYPLKYHNKKSKTLDDIPNIKSNIYDSFI